MSRELENECARLNLDYDKLEDDVFEELGEKWRWERMGPIKHYNHLIALRNARVEAGLPLSYGTGTNKAIPKINKEKIREANQPKEFVAPTITVRGRRTFTL